jgi:outer membrane protein assembly factor BamB
MTETDPSPDIPPGPDPGYVAAATTAWVALTFCLCMVGLLTVNAVQARYNEPLTPAQIEVLRAQLGTQPHNDALRTQIRDLDASLRTGYFTARTRAIQGTYLLAVGILVFLISTHLTAKLRARLPLPDPRAAGRSWIDAALGLRSMTALGLVMVGLLLTMLMLARHDTSAEYVRAAQQGPSGTGVAGSVPDAAPGAGGVKGLGPPPAQPATTGGPVRQPGRGAPVPPAAQSSGGTPAPKPQPTSTSSGTSTAPATDKPLEGWTAFRGPVGGVADAGGFLTGWDHGTPHPDASGDKGVLWKTELPLPGHNSPLVFGGHIFLSGADKTHRAVFCLNAADGKLLWQKPCEVLQSGKPEPPKVMEDTGYAASTMATDGQRVFAIFPNGDVFAHDLKGERKWGVALGMPDNVYGHASSLACYLDRIIIQYDQGSSADDGKSALIALDAATGKEVWRTKRPVPNSWGSPLVITADGHAQVVTTADPFVISYDPQTGKELWRTKCLTGDVGPSACYADGVVYAAANMAGLFAIRATPKGDKKAGDVLWEGKEGLPDTCSPATDGKLVFVISNYGSIVCYNAPDGKKLWEQEMRTQFQSSPVIVGNRVYVADTKGVTYILEAADTYKPIGTGQLGEPVRATPAFVDGRIYVRGDSNLYCLGAQKAAG